jgi:hypothetical protein
MAVTQTPQQQGCPELILQLAHTERRQTITQIFADCRTQGCQEIADVLICTSAVGSLFLGIYTLGNDTVENLDDRKY